MAQATAPWSKIQSYVGEFVCTFIFGFTVYAAILTSSIAEIPSGQILVGLSIGFCGISIIYAFLDVTIAHFNPAITIAAVLYGFLEPIKGLFYVISQLLGFMAAAGFVILCFPGDGDENVNIINPKGVSDDVTTGEIIGIESFLTAFLIFIAFAVAINRYKKPVKVTTEEEELLTRAEDTAPDTTILGPLIIGLTLGFLALLGGATSGGAFNPGVVFAPTLFSGDWSQCWKYWIGQLIGLIVGGGVQIMVMTRLY